MRKTAQAGAAVQFRSLIASVTRIRFTGVKRDTMMNGQRRRPGLACWRELKIASSGDGVLGARKHGEAAVPFYPRAYRPAGIGLDSLFDKHVVGRQGPLRRAGVLLQQPRATLDVGKEKSNAPARQSFGCW
jgi:hypothetical protein